MDSSLEQIRNQQRETWDRFSAGWKKWDAFTMDFLRPMGDAIIADLKIRSSDVVLDVAAGTGEPGLSIARFASNGRVVASDLSAKMLAVAQSNADRLGLKNFETCVADICALPLADSAFDAISCRMGFMFFPDMNLAAREMARVLKKGGRMATSVWNGADKNAWIVSIMSVVGERLQLPKPDPEAPGMFRCARPGLIKLVLENAGFGEIIEREIFGKTKYENADHYWANMMDVAAPVVIAMDKADEPTRRAVKEDVYRVLQQHSGAGPIELDFSARVISGKKL